MLNLVRNFVRGLAVLLGLPLAASGAFGWKLATSGTGSAEYGLVGKFLDATQNPWLDANLFNLLKSSAGHYGLLGVGLALIALAVFWRGNTVSRKAAPAKGKTSSAANGKDAKSDANAKSASKQKSSSTAAKESAAKPRQEIQYDKSTAKKVLKEAQLLEQSGQFKDAAELQANLGDYEKAVELFLQAGLYDHAAGIRHDENRFIEAAELYIEGGNLASAAALYAAHDEPLRSAECYEKMGKLSAAAEMYEKANKIAKAADCYAAAEYHRHAASCYVKVQMWAKAAQSLEQVTLEEKNKLGSGGSDPQKEQELRKLVMQTARLWGQSGDNAKAKAILLRGGCYGAAADLAFEAQAYEEAADYFLRARNPEKAADALRKAGKDKEADRVLGSYYRDLGDEPRAAQHFEAAEEFGEAGDIYRRLEQFEKAGDCLEKATDYYSAAEMFRACNDLQRAGACFEKAGAYDAAAECFGQTGDAAKNASLLEKGGRFFAAGKKHYEAGREEEAIKILQQVEPESAEFCVASGLLGEIFRKRNMLPLAIKKLRQAVGDHAVSAENVQAYFSLAQACGAEGNWAEAVEIFEKVMAFDFHFNHVEDYLAQARAALKNAEAEKTRAAATHKAQDGRYEIVGELGRGGMGIVYRAKDTTLDREVAYKVLPSELKENPQALKNFLAEAKAAAALNHPGIVCVYDAGEQDGNFYIAMELVEGTTLKDIVKKRGAIAPNGVLHVLVQMCEALAYAHDKKIAHRDIKPANTMWTRDKKAKIMDFGLAKLIEEVRNHTTVVSGTPYYMSPEQTLGKSVDHRTDIYSLGVSIFELATGTLPFKEGNVPYHHVHTPPPNPLDIKPDLPPLLAKIILRCMSKDPNARYQSARDILQEVRNAMARGEVAN